MEAGTITSDQVPKTGESFDDGVQETHFDPATEAKTTKAESSEGRVTTYTVLAGESERGPFGVIGTFKGRTQREARVAAVEASPHVKESILNDESVFLVALSSFNPVPAGVRRRDPEISV